jgi:hypothetical protein
MNVIGAVSTSNHLHGTGAFSGPFDSRRFSPPSCGVTIIMEDEIWLK